MPISYSDADKIYVVLIQGRKSKLILSTFKELYQIPSIQPTNKQIADAIYDDLVKLGYSESDAAKHSDEIEELSGRKRQPNISLVAEAVELLTTDTTKPTYLHLVSDQESPVAYDAFLTLCKSANGEPLEEHKDSIVRLFNFSHSVVQHGSKTLICEKTTDHKENVEYVFSAVPQKKSFYDNLNLPHLQDNKIKSTNCFDVWMKDPDRKTYHGVVFDPSGRAVVSAEGDDLLDPVVWHLRNVICNGNDEDFKYLLAWMAHIIQKPKEKSGVCLVLKSETRGTGKVPFLSLWKAIQ